jgi:hypothetical protein
MSQAARLDIMEEILLEDRFAAALAAAPAISCAVPMPPTMPAVKISANGLPMPFRLESNAPIFHRHGKKRPASAGPVMKLLDNETCPMKQRRRPIQLQVLTLWKGAKVHSDEPLQGYYTGR